MVDGFVWAVERYVRGRLQNLPSVTRQAEAADQLLLYYRYVPLLLYYET